MHSLRHFFSVVALLALSLLGSSTALALPAMLASNDELFEAARAAYQKRDEQALQQYTQLLQQQNYILASYADYWLMLLRLNNSDPDTVQQFLAQYADVPFADRLRGEWLKTLARRQDWSGFLAEYPNYRRDDVAVTCYAIEARALADDSAALQEGKAIWMTATEQPATCSSMFDRMQLAGVLTNADVWARFRLTLQEGKLNLAKAVVQRIAKFSSTDLKLVDKTYQNPQQVLEKNTISLKTPYGRALNLYALERLARTQPDYAADLWDKLQTNYTTEERRYFWSRMALHAARRHDPAALEYFARAKDYALDKEQRAWKVRAAIRIRDWVALQSAVAEMPAEQQEEAAWRYWQGRALKEQKNIPAANAILVPLARESTYYGLLAQEELGDSIGALANNYKASEEQVEAVQSLAGMQRAIALQKFDMRWESRMEWVNATQNFTDQQMLAAAELAVRQQWYDLAIITADKTKLMHDYALRYPTPYRSSMQSFAREQSLDEAWVYGITRQESRFMHYAKSGVGASGLMQVMPATAKWIAKRMGWNEYRNDMIHQLDTNIQLGTYYLRYTLDMMNGQALMATAAYNAGPGRAKRWAADQPLEGAIYAETIPFAETRGYVQKVMANAYFYAHRLGTKVQSLKQRLGVVAGTGSVLPVDEVEPGSAE